jgi:uncharacterized protein (TIGR03437 family)
VAKDEAENAAPPLEVVVGEGRVLAGGVVNAASYQPGPVAPGAWVAVFGVGLEGTRRAALHASNGRAYPLEPSYVSSAQVNLRLPEDIALGTASLRLDAAPPVDIRIERTSPGMLQGAGGRSVGNFGAPTIALCAIEGPCQPGPIVIEPGSATVMSLYGTGWRWVSASEIDARIGVQPVEVLGVERHPQFAGLDVIRLRLPVGFALRGYQFLLLSVDGKRANLTWLWFR